MGAMDDGEGRWNRLATVGARCISSSCDEFVIFAQKKPPALCLIYKKHTAPQSVGAIIHYNIVVVVVSATHAATRSRLGPRRLIKPGFVQSVGSAAATRVYWGLRGILSSP